MTGLLPPFHEKVPRGSLIEIELEFPESLGSPSPTLTFTMAASRDNPTKLYTVDVDVVEGEPTKYRVPLGPSVTNITPATYWCDVWWVAAHKLVAIGSLQVQGVVRLP